MRQTWLPVHKWFLEPLCSSKISLTVLFLSQQEKTNVRSNLGGLEIYHNGPVKLRPDHLFPAFTTGEQGPPDFLFI